MSHLSDIKPGQVIGRYEFLAPIAQGGMAAVWGARQRGSRGFSKVVAIKTMLPSISDDPRFEKMFLAEAQIASRIRHGNVVEILDLGEENDILYLVMEWVDGESLSALRRRAAERGGIPLRIAVRIVADVCAGLHAAHELVDDEGHPFGLVHRDVSPQNVLVGYDGMVKILDFGVAKVAGRTTDTTNIGQARGKPPYMAPEQALGKEVDRRADIFALGVIFYQLIVGRHPFRGENDIATLHNIISDQLVVAPRTIDHKISAQVEAIAMRALERDPHRRFQSTREFELALEATLDSELGRVRLEEIEKLMSDAFGAVREDRRSAIREAIRRADAAAQRQLEAGLTPIRESSPRAGTQSLEENIETSRLDASVVDALREADSRPALRSSSSNELLTDRNEDEPSAVIESKRNQKLPLANAWLRVLVAMGIGAVLSWGWLTLRAKKLEPPRQLATSSIATIGTTVPNRSAPSVTNIAVTQPEGGRSNAALLVTPEPTNPKKPGGITHIPQSGRKPPSGQRSEPHSGLPPVPSPGF